MFWTRTLLWTAEFGRWASQTAARRPTTVSRPLSVTLAKSSKAPTCPRFSRLRRQPYMSWRHQDLPTIRVATPRTSTTNSPRTRCTPCTAVESFNSATTTHRGRHSPAMLQWEGTINSTLALDPKRRIRFQQWVVVHGSRWFRLFPSFASNSKQWVWAIRWRCLLVCTYHWSLWTRTRT